MKRRIRLWFGFKRMQFRYIMVYLTIPFLRTDYFTKLKMLDLWSSDLSKFNLDYRFSLIAWILRVEVNKVINDLSDLNQERREKNERRNVLRETV